MTSSKHTRNKIIRSLSDLNHMHAANEIQQVSKKKTIFFSNRCGFDKEIVICISAHANQDATIAKSTSRTNRFRFLSVGVKRWIFSSTSVNNSQLFNEVDHPPLSPNTGE